LYLRKQKEQIESNLHQLTSILLLLPKLTLIYPIWPDYIQNYHMHFLIHRPVASHHSLYLYLLAFSEFSSPSRGWRWTAPPMTSSQCSTKTRASASSTIARRCRMTRRPGTSCWREPSISCSGWKHAPSEFWPPCSICSFWTIRAWRLWSPASPCLSLELMSFQLHSLPK